jgi:hypothetical protein
LRKEDEKTMQIGQGPDQQTRQHEAHKGEGKGGNLLHGHAGDGEGHAPDKDNEERRQKMTPGEGG